MRHMHGTRTQSRDLLYRDKKAQETYLEAKETCLYLKEKET
jgi:hypothetical protein